jgi:hypothetical protein
MSSFEAVYMDKFSTMDSPAPRRKLASAGLFHNG